MIHKPTHLDNSKFYSPYLLGFTKDDLIDQLNVCTFQTLIAMESITEAQGNFRYADGKWSVKQLMRHISDTERVFSYRALHFSRENHYDLPGFDENEFAKYDNSDALSLHSVMEEYLTVRKSTITLFETMDSQLLDNQGTASGVLWTVRLLGWVNAGHNLHHLRVLQDRYIAVL